MGYMSSLYSSMCVVIHNKGTGVDKISWENETFQHEPLVNTEY